MAKLGFDLEVALFPNATLQLGHKPIVALLGVVFWKSLIMLKVILHQRRSLELFREQLKTCVVMKMLGMLETVQRGCPSVQEIGKVMITL